MDFWDDSFARAKASELLPGLTVSLEIPSTGLWRECKAKGGDGNEKRFRLYERWAIPCDGADIVF